MVNFTYWHQFPSNFTYTNGSMGSVNGIGTFFQYATIVSNGAFSIAILFLVWLISFVLMSSASADKKIAIASFITTMLAAYLAYVQMLSKTIFGMMVAFTIVTILLVRSNNPTGI